MKSRLQVCGFHSAISLDVIDEVIKLLEIWFGVE